MEYSDKPQWYILHTYSAYENKVVDSLHKLIESNNYQDRILRIEVPTEEVVVEKNGKKKVVLHKKFPCYVYIKAILDTELWYLITGISGATSFCGPEGRAQELTKEEIKRLGFEVIDEEDLDIVVGDHVKIISGPFVNYLGEVESLDFDTQKVKVSIEMFGQKTPMDVEFKDVLKLTSEDYEKIKTDTDNETNN
jgi:transcriptional antiterminator NusG